MKAKLHNTLSIFIYFSNGSFRELIVFVSGFRFANFSQKFENLLIPMPYKSATAAE